MEQHGPNNAHSSRQSTLAYGSGYFQGPQSAPSSSISEYSFKHQRTQSSSTSSPYVSPRTEIPGYSSSAPNPFYQQQQQQQQQAREPVYTYQQGQPTDFQSRQVPQLAQPVAPFRQHQLPSQPLSSDPTMYSRTLEWDDRPNLQLRNHTTPLPTQPIYYPTTSLLSFPERPTDIFQSRPQPLQPPLPNLLPPLESTVTPGHVRGVFNQTRSDYVVPSTEAHDFIPMANQTSLERGQEGYVAQPTEYTPATHPKRDNG